MKERAPIITLVGSTKFKDLWQDTARKLYQEGAIVLTTHVFSHADGFELSADKQREYDAKYLQQIDISDAILVLNKGGYIGLSAWDEIFYAMAHRKAVYFLYPLSEECEHNLIDSISADNDVQMRVHPRYNNDDLSFYGFEYETGYMDSSINRRKVYTMVRDIL